MFVEMSSIERLRQSIADHPDWYATKHAFAIGVSRERVRQLCAEYEITLPRKQCQPPKPYQRRTHCKRGHDLNGGTRCWPCNDTAHKRGTAKWQAKNQDKLREYRARYEQKRRVTL